MLQSAASNKQKGFVVVLLLLIITLGISGYLLSELNFSQLEQEREQKTTQALLKAKKALMARMIFLFDGSTPAEIGSLACPDEDNDGSSDGCAGTIVEGRIPFRTLDIPEIRDGFNVRLWYATPNIFDEAESDNVNYENLHDVNHQLTLDGEAVSVIIAAPGLALDGQDRNSAGKK